MHECVKKLKYMNVLKNVCKMLEKLLKFSENIASIFLCGKKWGKSKHNNMSGKM